MALPSLSASEVEEGEDAAALILKHGAAVVRGVVSLATCAETRARIDERLRLANLEAFGEESTTAEFSAAGRTPEQVDAAARYFGNVTAPVHRRDLKLALNEEVGECVRQLLRACGPCIASILTADAEMCELSALVSDPGAPAQPLHPDTQTSGTRAHCGLITAFVATQDVTPEMGPTEVCARSNVAEAHRALSNGGGVIPFLNLRRGEGRQRHRFCLVISRDGSVGICWVSSIAGFFPVLQGIHVSPSARAANNTRSTCSPRWSPSWTTPSSTRTIAACTWAAGASSKTPWRPASARAKTRTRCGAPPPGS